MPDVSIVIPTKNESDNIGRLLSEISVAMVGISYEVLVVDDSDNNQTTLVAGMNGAIVIVGQHKGLGQAIIDGIQNGSGNTVVVMDGDLSHRPQDITRLLRPIFHDGYDMAIGSRYVKGGQIIGWEWRRKLISLVACIIALPITKLRDNTSGFFAFRKRIVANIRLKPDSWKIMLEVLLKAKPTRVLEVPIVFMPRFTGKSKFNSRQSIIYLKHLALLAFWKYQRFIKFCIVGGIGALITFGVTWYATEILGLWYMFSLVMAVAIATVSNFTLNSLWTFKLMEDPTIADYEWRSFYKGNLIQKWWKQQIAKVVWDYIPNSSKLLDVGCGSSPIITRYPGAMACDLNCGKLEFMREKCPEVNFVEMSVEHILYNDDSFDKILCVEVLEHLKEPGIAVSELSRVLKSGGQAVIATPDYSKWLWRIAEKFTPYKEDHYFQFTKDKLIKLCSENKLDLVGYRYVAYCDLVALFEKSAK